MLEKSVSPATVLRDAEAVIAAPSTADRNGEAVRIVGIIGISDRAKQG